MNKKFKMIVNSDDMGMALFVFRDLVQDQLTEEEKAEQETIQIKNKDRKISNNQYCAFGCYEDQEIMSMDTH